MDCGEICVLFLQPYLIIVIIKKCTGILLKIFFQFIIELADGPSVEMIKKIKKLILNNTIDFSLKFKTKSLKLKKIYI